MEMTVTYDLLFMLIQALVTYGFGWVFKDSIIPSRWIPLQNFIIGIVSGFVAVYFGFFTNIPTAIAISLFVSMGVGGTYDLGQISNKNKKNDIEHIGGE